MINQKTSNLNCMLLSQFQTGAHLAINENFNLIDSILNTSLKGDVENGENSPPSSPENYLYFIGVNPQGAWAGVNQGNGIFANSKSRFLARSNGENGWIYIEPKNGLILWHEEKEKLYVFSKGVFKEIGFIK